MAAGTFLCCSWTLALSHPKVQQERCGAPLSLDPWVIPGSKQSHGIWFDPRHWHLKKPPAPGRRRAASQARSLHLVRAKAGGNGQILTLRAGLGTRNQLTRIPRWILTWHKGGRSGSQHTTIKTIQETVTDPLPSLCTLVQQEGLCWVL